MELAVYVTANRHVAFLGQSATTGDLQAGHIPLAERWTLPEGPREPKIDAHQHDPWRLNLDLPYSGRVPSRKVAARRSLPAACSS